MRGSTGTALPGRSDRSRRMTAITSLALRTFGSMTLTPVAVEIAPRSSSRCTEPTALTRTNVGRAVCSRTAPSLSRASRFRSEGTASSRSNTTASAPDEIAPWTSSAARSAGTNNTATGANGATGGPLEKFIAHATAAGLFVSLRGCWLSLSPRLAVPSERAGSIEFCYRIRTVPELTHQ